MSIEREFINNIKCGKDWKEATRFGNKLKNFHCCEIAVRWITGRQGNENKGYKQFFPSQLNILGSLLQWDIELLVRSFLKWKQVRLLKICLFLSFIKWQTSKNKMFSKMCESVSVYPFICECIICTHQSYYCFVYF